MQWYTWAGQNFRYHVSIRWTWMMCIFSIPWMLTIVSTNIFTLWRDHTGKWPPSLVFFVLIKLKSNEFPSSSTHLTNRATGDLHKGQDSTNINYVKIFSLIIHRRYRSAFLRMNNMMKFVLTDRLIFLSTYLKSIQICIDDHVSA
jgi:hypothetical protein